MTNSKDTKKTKKSKEWFTTGKLYRKEPTLKSEKLIASAKKINYVDLMVNSLRADFNRK